MSHGSRENWFTDRQTDRRTDGRTRRIHKRLFSYRKISVFFLSEKSVNDNIQISLDRKKLPQGRFTTFIKTLRRVSRWLTLENVSFSITFLKQMFIYLIVIFLARGASLHPGSRLQSYPDRRIPRSDRILKLRYKLIINIKEKYRFECPSIYRHEAVSGFSCGKNLSKISVIRYMKPMGTFFCGWGAIP